jgi:hypothetical protein
VLVLDVLRPRPNQHAACKHEWDLYMTYRTYIRPISPMCRIGPIRSITQAPLEDEPEHEDDYPSTTQSSYTPGFTSFT